MQAFLGDNKEGFYMMGKVQDSERDPRNFGILFKKSCPANPHSDRSDAEQGVEKGSYVSSISAFALKSEQAMPQSLKSFLTIIGLFPTNMF